MASMNYFFNNSNKLQSNLYIKATQGNLKMWPLLAVALYIQGKKTVMDNKTNNHLPPQITEN
jgi:hypothetical protein